MYRPKILIAEDDPQWRELLAVALRRHRYRLYIAKNGREVHSLAERTRPDCIVLDFDLGDSIALEVSRFLKSKPHLEAIPLIILTAHTKERIRSYRDGLVDHFILKTGDTEELLAVLESVLRRVRWDRGVLERGDLRLMPGSLEALKDGRRLATLSPEQFRFLYTLASRRSEFIPASTLFHLVLGRRQPPEDSGALRVLATRVREKVGPTLARRIRCVKNLGWIYLPPKARPRIPENAG